MTWWMNRGCIGGPDCDPCAPSPCGPWVWACDPPRPRPVIHFDFPPPAQIPMPTLPAVQGEGGACCGSCAKGGGCESECEDKKKGHSHGHVGALYVSDAELDALGAQIALMGADVDVAVESQEATLPVFEGNLAHAVWQLCKDQKGTWDYKTQKCDFEKPDPNGDSIGTSPGSPPHPLASFRKDRWTPYQIKWNGYRGETFHAPTTYDTLRTEFQTLVDEWKSKGQTTRANVPPPLTDSSGSNAIPWFWIIVGGVVIAIPFMLPAIAGTYLAVTRGPRMGF